MSDSSWRPNEEPAEAPVHGCQLPALANLLDFIKRHVQRGIAAHTALNEWGERAYRAKIDKDRKKWLPENRARKRRLGG